MTAKTKQKFILLFTLFIVLAVYLWFYTLNTGTAIISTNLTNYKVTTSYKKFRCNKNPCKIEHRTGTWSFFIQKDGFSPVTKRLVIKRWKKVSFKTKLIKIVKLEISNVIPTNPNESPKKAIPVSLNINELVKPVWNQSQSKLVYLGTDDRLKIWSSEGIKPITIIHNLKSPLDLIWSRNKGNIVGLTDQSIFLINIKQGSRYKLNFDFTPKNPLFSPDGSYVLINDKANRILRIDFTSQRVTQLKKSADLKASAWLNKNLLLIAGKDNNNKRLLIETLNPIENTTEVITSKWDFSVDRIIFDSRNNTAYLRSGDKSIWYKMEF